MTPSTAHEALDLARSRGIVLDRNGDRLKFCGPAAAVAELMPLLVTHKIALLALLSLLGPACPSCGRQLDRERCWGCHWRLCELCGVRNTGSAFLARCLGCDLGSAGTSRS